MNRFGIVLGLVRGVRILLVFAIIFLLLLTAAGLYITITGNDFLPASLLPIK